MAGDRDCNDSKTNLRAFMVRGIMRPDVEHTIAKRRGIANFFCSNSGKSLRQAMYASLEVILSTSCSERGKAKQSSIKEAWKETLLIPSYFVPMWDQIEDAGDCCGLDSNNEKFHKPAGCQTRKSPTGAHVPVFVLCEIHTAERIACNESCQRTQKEAWRREAQANEEEETSTCALKFPNARWLLRCWPHLRAMAEVFWTLRGFPFF